MDYPWNKKTKEEVPNQTEIIENEEVIIEENPIISDDENIIENIESNEKNVVWDNDDPRAILLNILKLEGYKMDSGELFNAYREATGESENSKIMESFKNGLDQLSELGKIQSDSNGNIMTIQDYDREKSQTSTNEKQKDVIIEESEEVIEEFEEDAVNDVEEITDNKKYDNDDLESIIKLKEETDSWLIEKLKDNEANNNETDLREEVKELKKRIEKLEHVIKNITKAFE
jgi:hypothetical protein